MKEEIIMPAETALALTIWRALDEDARKEMLLLLREMVADQEREKADNMKGERG